MCLSVSLACNRLLRFVAPIMAACCCLVVGIESDSYAQDRRATTLIWDEPDSTADNWAPIVLTSAAANPSYSLSPVWNPNLQGLQGLTDIADYLPSTNFSSFTSNATSGQNQSPQNGKTGTGIDSLPSFRGIKGIKNLPGGVGTLLMANPHVGAAWYPEQSTNQPGTSLSMERTYFQAGVPVYHAGADTFVLTSHLDATMVHTNAILPTSMQAFPTQLFNIALGVNYFHQFESGKVGGIVFDLGSASDKPFESGRDILASGTGFFLVPRDEKSSWFVGVNASTNSQVLYGIPIPGGGYFYHPSENLQAIIGFPFSVVSYKPAPNWQLQYVYAFLTTMHARAVYQPTQKWQTYAGFDWTNENWRRAERTNDHDHFFYYEKKLATGFLWWFKPNVGLEMSGGWAFDRYFSEVNGFKLKGDNTVNIGSGPYLSSQIDIRF